MSHSRHPRRHADAQHADAQHAGSPRAGAARGAAARTHDAVGTAAHRRQRHALVWYAAYGSNMSSRRLRYYLAGGRPPGNSRCYPGARDGRAPARSRALRIPGGVYFAGHSRAWGGGLALYDPQLPGAAAVHAHLITIQQFSDIAAQEMARTPGRDLDLAEVLGTGRAQLGPGRYETLLRAGPDVDGIPVLTFTAPWQAHQTPWRSPAPHYLALVVRGLREAYGWAPERTAAYLRELPGVRGEQVPAVVDRVYAIAAPRPARPTARPDIVLRPSPGVPGSLRPGRQG
ncbi:histone deacetylase [Actinocatenispora sera]|uniref:histone deacetylase n=1 Tax=Actinocatenispora sera TaxID=390989 RepID=UPI0034092E3D